MKLLLLFVLSMTEATSIDYEIDEMVPINYLVANLPTQAQLIKKYPSSHSKLQFSLQPSTGYTYLRVDKFSGALFVRHSMDRESMCSSFPSTCCPTRQQPVCYIPLAVSVVLPTNSGGHDLKEVLQVRVHLKDINDSPCRFSPQDVQTVRFRENDPLNTHETLNTPRDADADFGVLQSRIRLVQPSAIFALAIRELPSLDPKYKLELVLRGSLDREQQDRYELTVRADDGNSSHSCHLRVIVEVLDANDQTPIFQNTTYSLLVREDHPVNEPLITVHATDNDINENGRITYDIDASVTTNLVMDSFKIDHSSGEVALIRPLDAGKMSRYAVPLIAKDHARRSLTGSATLLINVLDLNDKEPVVNILDVSGSDMSPSLLEEQSPGVDVATIRVSDGDKGVNGQVTCSIVNSEDSPFILNEFPGQSGMYKVTSQQRLNREKVKRENEDEVYVDFLLTCKDGGTPSRTVMSTGKVLLRDINDNPPVFHNHEVNVSVMEDSDPQRGRQGYYITKMNATDSDYGQNAALSWSIEELDSSNRAQTSTNFFIDGIGVIRSQARQGQNELDREKQSMHRLIVTAIDSGTPALSAKTTLTVHVLDYNDNSPHFQPIVHDDFTVVENVALNQPVCSLLATDADVGDNARLVYRIVESVNGLKVPFRVATESVSDSDGRRRYWARIYTDGAIDREALIFGGRNVQPVYDFKVMVQDSPKLTNEQRFGETRIQIKVLDENDVVPEWKQPEANSTLPPVSYLESKNYVVVTVLATDLDALQNGTISYRIISGNSRGLFRLNAQNGSLQLARHLSMRDMDVYSLTLEARDQGPFPQKSRISFKIRIDNSSPKSIHHIATQNVDPVNLYIIVAIIVASFVIAMVLLTAICVVLRKHRERPLNNGLSTMYKAADFQLSYPASPMPSPNRRNDVSYPCLLESDCNSTLLKREVTFACQDTLSELPVSSYRPPPYHYYPCSGSQQLLDLDREKDCDSGNGDSVDVMTTYSSYVASVACPGEQSNSFASLSKMRSLPASITTTSATALGDFLATGGTYSNMSFNPKCMITADNFENIGSNNIATVNRGSGTNLSLFAGSGTLNRNGTLITSSSQSNTTGSCGKKNVDASFV